MKRIIYITDGNEVQGLGHVYQSKTFANYLISKSKVGVNITFLTKSDDSVITLISEEGYNIIKCGSDSDIFKYLQNKNPDIIIFDKIDVNPILAKNIKNKLRSKLVIFTNLSTANDYADISILADIGSDFKNIKEILQNNQIKYFGPKYWILRPEFYSIKKNIQENNEIIKNILLIFGGADPCNYSLDVARGLLSMNDNFNLNIIVGMSYKYISSLNEVLKKNKNRVTLLRNVKNVAFIMKESDLVITSPGISFFEALVVGTPVICFHQDELQKKVYSTTFDTYGKENIHLLPSIIKSRRFVFPDNPLVKEMEIGEGITELINQILYN
ncbi:MAG: hypothetical protein LLF80_06565 [Porphyromonadaceae bacterium]|nr:hypothetical protein [Porphyromonadaceae bacterium]